MWCMWILFVISSCMIYAFPEKRIIVKNNLFSGGRKINKGIVEEDIILRKLRTAIRGRYYRWPNGTVPYVISNNFSNAENKTLRTSMTEIEINTRNNVTNCITFVERTTEADYLDFQLSSRCASFVGRVGGAQPLYVGRHCLMKGVMIHELTHALGFFHEINRYDRHRYIHLHTTNIAVGDRPRYYKETNQTMDLLGTPYDFSSLMHYGAYDGSVDKSRPFISPKDDKKYAGVVMGHHYTMSQLDVKRIQKLYKCKTALVKAKEYKWKDSNLEFFGTDVERNIKKDSAKTEPAWKNAGLKPGLQIWRIVKFKVMEWPLKDYGKFFNGDSYIVLHTYKEPSNEQLLYDVHFWIGKYSTQDEYGTAAYKTVELDTHLDDVPIQHREVQEHESDLFCSYFPIITIMEGGADSGFKKVKPEAYKPRLLHFHGDRRGVRVTEVPRSTPVDSGDVYIFDLGLRLIQWNGKGSNKEERFRALRYIKGIVNERRGKPQTDTVDEGSGDGDFNSYLTELMETEEQFLAADRTKKLFRLSDASGELLFTLERKGDVSIDYFDSKDVFIFDTKSQVFVWTGNQTSPAERRNAVSYAHKYLMKTDHPHVPVESLSENGRKLPAFQNSTRLLTYQQYVCKARDTRRI